MRWIASWCLIYAYVTENSLTNVYHVLMFCLCNRLWTVDCSTSLTVAAAPASCQSTVLRLMMGSGTLSRWRWMATTLSWCWTECTLPQAQHQALCVPSTLTTVFTLVVTYASTPPLVTDAACLSPTGSAAAWRPLPWMAKSCLSTLKLIGPTLCWRTSWTWLQAVHSHLLRVVPATPALTEGSAPPFLMEVHNVLLSSLHSLIPTKAA